MIAKGIDIEKQIPKDIYLNAISELKNRKIFLSGGTGFFGKSLLEVLGHLNEIEKLNLELCILSRNPQAFSQNFPQLCHSFVQLVKGEVENFDFPQGQFDYVFHFATPANSQLIQQRPQEILKIMREGSKRMLDFCVHTKASKYLFASSGAVYGKQPENLSHMTEDYAGQLDPESSFNVYAEGKIYAEELGNSYADKYGFEHKIARCFAFVGPYLDPNGAYAVGNFIRDALLGKEITLSGTGSPRRSYLYSDDLIFWLLKILSHAQSKEAYNVGSDKDLSILDLAKLVQKKINPAVEIKVLGQTQDARSVPYVPSIKKAREKLGLDVWTNLGTAIEKTALAYKAKLGK